MPLLMSGQPVAQHIYSQIEKRLDSLQQAPTLAILQVGDVAASTIYVKKKLAAAKRIGIATIFEHLPATASQDEVLSIISQWNTDATVTAILIQLPLPQSLASQSIISSILPSKDVDGLHPLNVGLLVSGQPNIIPATAKGVMRLLDYYTIGLASKRVLVIGRSSLVGKPTAMLLLQRNATVTMAHSQTANLSELLSKADVIISAAGKPFLIKPEQVSPKSVIVDVSISRLPQGIVGDADLIRQTASVEAISPVPGGIGPLTIACLLENVLDCYDLQH